MILTAMFYTCLAGTEHKAQFRFDFKGQAGLAEADMLRHNHIYHGPKYHNKCGIDVACKYAFIAKGNFISSPGKSQRLK